MSTVVVDKVESDPEEEARLERIKKKPDVTECFNLMDFEVNTAKYEAYTRLWQDK